MEQRTVVITGASSGLGFECARALARSGGWGLVLACRDVGRGEAAAARIRAELPGAQIAVRELELASLSSGRSFALGVNGPLRALVCNAGVQEISKVTRTRDGFETTFAVNHLGHFLLAHLLLERLAPDGQIVFVSSNTHDPRQHTGMPEPRYTTARQISVDDEPGELAGRRRYTTSKLSNVLCAYELARRLAGASNPALKGIRVNAFDPGLMPGTGLARDYGALARLGWRYLLPVLTLLWPNVNSVERSGERLARLAVDQSAPTGRYFSQGRETPSSDESHDLAKAKDLWETSLELAGLSESKVLD
jgi:NAD(P)-dependent dehydrogenase (short-subunit alcohol dehydrogenase family)